MDNILQKLLTMDNAPRVIEIKRMRDKKKVATPPTTDNVGKPEDDPWNEENWIIRR